jgi:hypothetical protein
MIGTSTSRYPYGPKRDRTPAQRRAGAAWVRSQSPSARAWLTGQPKLPDGWNMKGGRLNPPKDWVWEDGKLRPPHPQEIEAAALAKKVQAMIRRQSMNKKLPHRLDLHQRSWPDASGNWDTEEWKAIVLWMSDPENMKGTSGKTTQFMIRKNHRRLRVTFSQPNVAFAFFLRFAKPPIGARDGGDDE